MKRIYILFALAFAFLGSTVSEIASFLLIFILYKLKINKKTSSYARVAVGGRNLYI